MPPKKDEGDRDRGDRKDVVIEKASDESPRVDTASDDRKVESDQGNDDSMIAPVGGIETGGGGTAGSTPPAGSPAGPALSGVVGVLPGRRRFKTWA